MRISRETRLAIAEAMEARRALRRVRCGVCENPGHDRRSCTEGVVSGVVNEALIVDRNGMGDLRHILACGCAVRCNCDIETGDMPMTYRHRCPTSVRAEQLVHHRGCCCRTCSPDGDAWQADRICDGLVGPAMGARMVALGLPPLAFLLVPGDGMVRNGTGEGNPLGRGPR